MELNRGPLRRETVDAHPLTPRQIQQLDAPVIDIRTPMQFDDAHIPGAICNTMLQAGFGTRLAWIAGPDQEVVLVGRDDADALRAAELAAAVGVFRIAGYLAGGMTSWWEERLPTASIERITVPELHERIDELQVLDVRERDEWEAGHIPGSLFTPYHDLDDLPADLDLDRAGGGDLRVRSARGGRRQPRPAARRARRPARRRRRRARLGPARLAAQPEPAFGAPHARRRAAALLLGRRIAVARQQRLAAFAAWPEPVIEARNVRAASLRTRVPVCAHSSSNGTTSAA